MNYTNNVNCHQMKPLERKFFKFVCKQIDYESLKFDQFKLIRSMNEIIEEFICKYDIPVKMIGYWLEKWSMYGFYESGVNIYFGWFVFTDALILNIPTKDKWGRDVNEKFRQYIDIVPERVKRQYKRAKNI